MSIIQRLAGGADFVLASTAPVDTDGGKPRPRYVVGQKLDELVQYLQNPPAQLDSLVSAHILHTPDATLTKDLKPAYLDAVKHLHSGLDDRKLLVSIRPLTTRSSLSLRSWSTCSPSWRASAAAMTFQAGSKRRSSIYVSKHPHTCASNAIQGDC